MIKHDLLNGRIKDFYDIWMLAQQFDFDGQTLATAIQKTFGHRGDAIPERPAAFGDAFTRNPIKIILWKNFIRKSRLNNAPETLDAAASSIAEFLVPLVGAIAQGKAFELHWKAGGPWKPDAPANA